MFKQVELGFANDALEPVIDTLTVETHYGKHHKAYTNTFISLAEKAGVADKSVEEIMANLNQVAEDVRTPLRNNAGGYYNHNLYFSTISPDGPREPFGELAEKINATFGSYEALKEQLTALALSQFGSGWAWLSVKKDGSLVTSKTPNQDNPIILGEGATPILAIDVWEHAYYLKYKNLRADYVKELFNILDWNKINAVYEQL